MNPGRDELLAAIVGNQSEKAIDDLPIVLLIVAGEIDLSIASVAALAAAVMASLFQAGVPLPVGIVAALLVGAAAGLLNGSLVARLRLPSLVATLGTLALFRGLSSVILEGQAVTGFPRWFTDFGYGFVPGTLIPAPIGSRGRARDRLRIRPPPDADRADRSTRWAAMRRPCASSASPSPA